MEAVDNYIEDIVDGTRYGGDVASDSVQVSDDESSQESVSE